MNETYEGKDKIYWLTAHAKSASIRNGRNRSSRSDHGEQAQPTIAKRKLFLANQDYVAWKTPFRALLN
jgi:hypothetical protein